jgi:hypothetical protein
MRRVLPALLLATGCAPGAAEPGAVDVWVADPGAGVVWRDAEGGRSAVITAETPGAGLGFDPSALVVDGRGRLVVTDFADGTVSTWDGLGLAVLFENAADPGGLRLEEPCAVLAGPGTLTVLANDTENIAFLTDDGAVLDELGPASLLGGAHGFAALPDGTLLVASSPPAPGAPTLRVWDPATGGEGRAFGAGLETPTDLVVLDDGTVAVTDWSLGAVARVDPATGARLEWLAEGLDRPVALARLGDELLVLAQDGVWAAGAGVRVVDGAGFVFPRDLALVPR